MCCVGWPCLDPCRHTSAEYEYITSWVASPSKYSRDNTNRICVCKYSEISYTDLWNHHTWLHITWFSFFGRLKRADLTFCPFMTCLPQSINIFMSKIHLQYRTIHHDVSKRVISQISTILNKQTLISIISQQKNYWNTVLQRVNSIFFSPPSPSKELRVVGRVYPCRQCLLHRHNLPWQ